MYKFRTLCKVLLGKEERHNSFSVHWVQWYIAHKLRSDQLLKIKFSWLGKCMRKNHTDKLTLWLAWPSKSQEYHRKYHASITCITREIISRTIFWISLLFYDQLWKIRGVNMRKTIWIKDQTMNINNNDKYKDSFVNISFIILKVRLSWTIKSANPTSN